MRSVEISYFTRKPAQANKQTYRQGTSESPANVQRLPAQLVHKGDREDGPREAN